MRSRLFLALCAVSGCGFTTPGIGGSDAHPSDSTDSSIDAPADGVPIDGPPLQSSCMSKWMNHTVQLSVPVQLSAFGSSSTDRDPYISRDGKELYFASYRSGGGEAYVAKRPTATGPFLTPVLAADVNSTGSDDKLSLTADGRTVVIASSRSGGAGGADLWTASRTVGGTFGTFTRTPFGTADDANDQQDAEVNADGTRVYYAIGTPQRIVQISRTNTGDTFGGNSDVIDSGFGDADPSVSADERLILFSSNRPSGATGGPMFGNIWYGTRADATTTSFTYTLVPTVNGDNGDGDPSLSSDGCTLYFASDRSGNFELYQSDVIGP